MTTKRQSKRELRELQTVMASAVMRPLDAEGGMRKRWVDGRSMKTVAAEFIKPNSRVTSFERLEVYNRQYWFRVLDCLYDDYPGLRAILGERKFSRFAVRYMEVFPSASFTLRNLGRHLEEFIRDEPQFTRPRQAQCIDMARLEWAHVEAFDEGAERPVTVDDLLGKEPSKIRLRLQPHLRLLELDYPVDDVLLSLKEDHGLRGDAGNALGKARARTRAKVTRLLRSKKVFLAVHRHDRSVYYKRLELAQHALLKAIESGKSLEAACVKVFSTVGKSEPVDPQSIQTWFQDWSALGWFWQM